MRTKRAGVSLIELVIGMSLASFVLAGVAGIAAQMTRAQVEGIRSGTATGWSVISYIAMSKEIEDGNVLAFPIADGAGADQLILCKNWSRAQGALPGGQLYTIDPVTNAAANTSVVQYCVDSTDASNLLLRRFENTGPAVQCPNPGVPVACTDAPSGTWTKTDVVGFRLEKLSGANVFTRANNVGGVRVRYVIGRQTPTTNDPNPRSTPFDIAIAMNKNYSSTLD
ncbi:MAG: hypothetical protein M0D55_09785 [Elusimicrobiota bacterium]|nr:MAG: hypothetical protein M0D55_09785 [Elusimicrobiota bacterium]